MPLAPFAIADSLEEWIGLGGVVGAALIASLAGVRMMLGHLRGIQKDLQSMRGEVEHVKRSSAEAAHQTKNHHTENLRDNLDRRFNDLDQKLDDHGHRLQEVERGINRQWQRTADLGSRDDRIDSRLAHLERREQNRQDGHA